MSNNLRVLDASAPARVPLHDCLCGLLCFGALLLGVTAAYPHMAVATWTPDQVLAMLDQLGLSHVKQPFRDNGVSGSLLVALDETELTGDLGLTHLQAKNVTMHLR